MTEATPTGHRVYDKHHEAFMREAFAEAKAAVAIGEVPVGCVFVKDGKIIARGHNLTNQTRNATEHAELVAISKLWKEIHSDCKKPLALSLSSTHFTPSKILEGVTLYVTVEPCIMCAWALRLASLYAVYFGASNPRFGGNSSVLSLQNTLEPHDHSCPEMDVLGKGYLTYPGLLEEEAIGILKEFYGQENMNAPVEKRKSKADRL